MESNSSVSARKVLWTSFLVDILDVILGVSVTIISGSVVMLAQALEGLADLASSGFLVFGLKKSSKKADPGHPFGYGRELYFWTLISALIMLSITATLTLFFGFQRLIHPEPLHNTLIANLVLLFTAGTNGYALSLSLRRLLRGRSVSKIWTIFYQSSLIETKTAFVLDLMGTTASVLGFIALLIYSLTQNSIFDALGAIAIGLAIAFFAIILLLAAKDFLIGKGVSIQTVNTIKNAAQRVEHVRLIKDLKATHSGPESILVNIEVNAKNDLTTDQLEKMIDDVKFEIKKDLPSAKHIQVELES